MTIRYTKRFRKQFKKLRSGEQERFFNQLTLFTHDPRHKTLNNHALIGKFTGYRSINIGGDIRAIYLLLDDGSVILFDLIGTHNQLYG